MPLRSSSDERWNATPTDFPSRQTRRQMRRPSPFLLSNKMNLSGNSPSSSIKRRAPVWDMSKIEHERVLPRSSMRMLAVYRRGCRRFRRSSTRSPKLPRTTMNHDCTRLLIAIIGDHALRDCKKCRISSTRAFSSKTVVLSFGLFLLR